jgi:hypothetical protein
MLTLAHDLCKFGIGKDHGGQGVVMTTRRQAEAGKVEPQPVHVRSAAGRDKQMAPADRLSGRQLQQNTRGWARDTGDTRVFAASHAFGGEASQQQIRPKSIAGSPPAIPIAVPRIRRPRSIPPRQRRSRSQHVSLPQRRSFLAAHRMSG